MKGYIIKGKYINSGREFFLDKDGYVVINYEDLRGHECYATARAAKMVATKRTKASIEQNEYNEDRNARRIAKGLEPLFHDGVCIYEAFEV